MEEFKFEGKFIITAELVAETGLHIGGATESIEIGGIDKIVIKDPLTGMPYLPGSSLKGKMRALLEWMLGQVTKNITQDEKGNPVAKPCTCGVCDACIIFGTSAAETKSNAPTRLIVRDAMPTGCKNDQPEEYSDTIKKWKDELGENLFTEVKWENVIDRITSAATPRQFERIPAGSAFSIEMIYDVYQKEDHKKLERVFQAMKLLEDSYLGGSGTRGYGKVRFQNISVKWQPVSAYQKIDKWSEETKMLVKNKPTMEIWTELTKNEDFNKLMEVKKG